MIAKKICKGENFDVKNGQLELTSRAPTPVEFIILRKELHHLFRICTIFKNMSGIYFLNTYFAKYYLFCVTSWTNLILNSQRLLNKRKVKGKSVYSSALSGPMLPGGGGVWQGAMPPPPPPTHFFAK